MSMRSIAALLLPLLLAACATPFQVSLSAEQRARLKEVKTSAIVVQDEVVVAVQPSQISLATGGGLLVAMIDSSITNSRMKESQKIMGPFYASIEDVDFRREFGLAIERELANSPIRVAQVTTTPRMLSWTDLNQIRGELAEGEAFQAIVTSYALSMDFKNLDAWAVVSLWTKGEDHMPIQRGMIRYQSQPVAGGGKASVERWTADDAALFRNVLRESVSELTKMVLLDVDLPAAPDKPENLQTYSFNSGAQQIQVKGTPLRESADRVLVLGSDRTLYSLPKNRPATETKE